MFGLVVDALQSWTAGVPAAMPKPSATTTKPSPNKDAGGDAGGPRKLALLIGPEGGFTPEERRTLRTRPMSSQCRFGPRILRAETAVIAALSIIQSVWGDWREA